jgi:thiamine pyridinylase
MKKLQNILLSLLIFTLAFLSPITLSSPNIAYAQITPKTTLKVALFPYIPDSAQDNFQTLLNRIESEFESQNPKVDLVLRPLNPVQDDFYDINTLKQWLSNSAVNDGYDLVEIDTLLLDDLVKANLIQPWYYPDNIQDWIPTGLRAVTINGKTYGVPHLLCGHFIFARDEKIVKTTSLKDLLTILIQITPDIPNLGGDLTGSWNLPALYLDSWADINGTEEVSQALIPQIDEKVFPYFQAFTKNCQVAASCFDTNDEDSKDIGAEAFINHQVDAFFGYSERLNYLFKDKIDPQVKIASLPLGRDSNPLLFTDALVLRQDCNYDCQYAARKFATYLNQPATQEWILSSKDAGKNAVPRYLIPATYSAFATPSLAQNSYYQTLKETVKNAAPYPNSGFPEVRKKLKNLILQKLQS